MFYVYKLFCVYLTLYGQVRIIILFTTVCLSAASKDIQQNRFGLNLTDNELLAHSQIE